MTKDEDVGAMIGLAILGLVLLAGFGYFVVSVATGGKVHTSPQWEAEARNAIENYGLTDVRDIYACFLCCDHNDTIRLSFKATGRKGQPVDGQACSGLLFKGWTIRTS